MPKASAKNLIPVFTILLIAFGMVLLPHISKADTIYAQTSENATSGISNYYGGGNIDFVTSTGNLASSTDIVTDFWIYQSMPSCSANSFDLYTATNTVTWTINCSNSPSSGGGYYDYQETSGVNVIGNDISASTFHDISFGAGFYYGILRTTPTFGGNALWPQMYIVTNGSDPFVPPPSSISLNYPLNGTTTALFQNWIVSSTNNNGFPGITLGVRWAGSTSTLINPQTPNSFGNDLLNLSNATGTSVFNFIPSTLYNTPMATTTWYAQAYMQTLGPTIVTLATSSIVSFTIDNTLPTIVDNTTFHAGQGFLAPNTATTTGYCVPPESSSWFNLADWGPGLSYGLCSVAQVYFGNQVPGYQFMQSEWQAFQGTPPFNLVFGVASSALSAVDDNASSTQQDLNISIPIGKNNATIPVLSSSTLWQIFVTTGNGANIASCDTTCAQGKWNTILGYMNNVTYALTGVTTVIMIL